MGSWPIASPKAACAEPALQGAVAPPPVSAADPVVQESDRAADPPRHARDGAEWRPAPPGGEESKKAGKVVFSGSDGDVRDRRSDPYKLSAARIKDDTLEVTVSFGGGCETHEFTLFVANAFMESDPVKVNVALAHNANGDPCEAWLTEERSFDLAPVREASGQKQGTIVLLLDNAPDGELRYDF